MIRPRATAMFDREAPTALFQTSKTLTQVAALPFVEIGTRIEILLITTRRRGRWIIPRGWPVEGMSFALAAAREAIQEAGVEGMVGEASIGDYIYQKRSGTGYRVPCRVFVYPLQVTHQRLDWREKDERGHRWCDISTAVSLVRQDALADFLSGLAGSPNLAARLAPSVTYNHQKAN